MVYNDLGERGGELRSSDHPERKGRGGWDKKLFREREQLTIQTQQKDAQKTTSKKKAAKPILNPRPKNTVRVVEWNGACCLCLGMRL